MGKNSISTKIKGKNITTKVKVQKQRQKYNRGKSLKKKVQQHKVKI